MKLTAGLPPIHKNIVLLLVASSAAALLAPTTQAQNSHGSKAHSRQGASGAPAMDIDEQARALHSSHTTEAKTAGSAILKQAQREADQIRRDGQRAADEYYMNYPRRLRRRGFANEGREAIKRESQVGAEDVMSKARDRAAAYQREAQERERLATEAAGNLRSQLKPTGTKGVRLKPEGTNLYIRNYGH